MGNLSIWHAQNLSATANISLWESRVSCFCHFFHGKPYAAETNLMTLVQGQAIEMAVYPCRAHGAFEKSSWYLVKIGHLFIK